MSHRPVRPTRFASAAVLLLAAFGHGPLAPPGITQATTYAGTVKAIQPGKSLDLITGVGYAIRIVHVSVIPATQIVRGAVAMRLDDITPGDVVRTECRMTDKGLVADRIEKLTPEGGTAGTRP